MMKIKIPTDKGNIAAVVNEPKEKTDRLAILCPGYLDSKDYDHLKILAEDLAKEGYTAVRFDPIGTWESDGDISDYTTTEYLKDVETVLNYMLKQNDFKNILIGGHSRGGKISMLYAAKDKRIKKIIAIMPSSVVHMFDDERIKAARETGFSVSKRDLPDDKNLTREFSVPISHFLDNKKYTILPVLNKIKAPLIIIAGELDQLEPPKDVKIIFDNANQPKKYILIKGVGHDYRKSKEEIRQVNNELLKALNFIN